MKTRSIPVATCVVVCMLLAAGFAGGAENEKWQSLFNGRNLDGWIRRGGEAKYRVEDDTIVGTTVKGTPNTFLCTKRVYGNFVLELDFKVDPNLNSGIQIRSESHPAYKSGRVHGYQVEIDPSDRAWSAGIYDEARRGWLNDLKDNEPARKAFKPRDWNHVRIEAKDDSIKTWLNSVPAADLDDDMTPVGFVALQVHGTNSDEPLEVRWRNIRIQDLDRKNTDPLADDLFMGDWGTGDADDSPVKTAQVIALDRGKYQINLLQAFDSSAAPVWVMYGKLTPANVVSFRSGDWWCEIDKAQSAAGGQSGDAQPSPIVRLAGGKRGDDPLFFRMRKFLRLSPTLGAEPPAGAVVLFDGANLDEWRTGKDKPAGWKIVEGGAAEIVPDTGSILTKRSFGDMKLHVEFRLPFTPAARGQGRGNSGVYIQDRYEVQVLDSYGLQGRDNECGGVYRVAAPRVNMCAPPMQWQTYDIMFHTPRFDSNGDKTRNARLTVVHNGVTIHEELDVPGPTGGARSKGETSEPGPILLQDHGNRVQYRNIWLVELD